MKTPHDAEDAIPIPNHSFQFQHSETKAATRARGSSGLLLFVAMNAVHWKINVVQQLIMEPQQFIWMEENHWCNVVKSTVNPIDSNSKQLPFGETMGNFIAPSVLPKRLTALQADMNTMTFLSLFLFKKVNKSKNLLSAGQTTYPCVKPATVETLSFVFTSTKTGLFSDKRAKSATFRVWVAENSEVCRFLGRSLMIMFISSELRPKKNPRNYSLSFLNHWMAACVFCCVLSFNPPEP